ncbi:MAG: DNA polymerase, partial [Candidatus Binatia bacterium]
QASLDLEGDDGARVAREAAVVRSLGPALAGRLASRGMSDLAATLEYPLVGVLARMEHAGILVDRAYLEELNEDLGAKMHAAERKIHEHAGEEFNVASTPQLQKILFEKLELQKTKKIKTGWSTDQAELAKIRDAHPIVEELLEYREVAKLKTGFTDALLPLINPKTGRIHTTYMQASASTGRLASTNPNMQNIPIRGELGRQIRRAFIAPDGHLLISADYSQIELRVLAHVSGDETLAGALSAGEDAYARTASEIFHVRLEDVDREQRRRAKVIVFAIISAIGPERLAEQLEISFEEAESYIAGYFARHPAVSEYVGRTLDEAREKGYVTTLLGRRRFVPDVSGLAAGVRRFAERTAVNTPIQGTAADLIKAAMVRIDARLRSRKSGAGLVLQVGDEILLEAPEERIDEVIALVREEMEGAAKLAVPLEVAVGVGSSWADLRSASAEFPRFGARL